MAVKNFVLPVALTSIDSASFTGNYQVINTNGLPHSCVLLRMVNNSNRDVTISWDGVTDHDFLKLGESLMLPFQSNALPMTEAAQVKQGQKIYVKAAAGTGLVYLTGYYQP
jgi:hypothetical protein